MAADDIVDGMVRFITAAPGPNFGATLSLCERFAVAFDDNYLNVTAPRTMAPAHRLIRTLCLYQRPEFFNLLKILCFNNEATRDSCRKEMISVVLGYDLSPLTVDAWFEEFVQNVMSTLASVIPDAQKVSFIEEIVQYIFFIDDRIHLAYTVAQVTEDEGLIRTHHQLFSIDIPTHADPLDTTVQDALAAQRAAIEALTAASTDADVTTAFTPLIEAAKKVKSAYPYPYFYLLRSYNGLTPFVATPIFKKAVQSAFENFLCLGVRDESRVLLTHVCEYFANEPELLPSIVNGIIRGEQRQVELQIQYPDGSHPYTYQFTSDLATLALAPPPNALIPLYDSTIAAADQLIIAPYAMQLLLEAAAGNSLAGTPFTQQQKQNILKACLSEDNLRFYLTDTTPDNKRITFLPEVNTFVGAIETALAAITAEITVDTLDAILESAPAAYLNVIPPNILIQLADTLTEDGALAALLNFLSGKELNRYVLKVPENLTAMQILIQKELFASVYALWHFGGASETAIDSGGGLMRNNYTGRWFPSEYIIPATKFDKSTTDATFRKQFYDKYKTELHTEARKADTGYLGYTDRNLGRTLGGGKKVVPITDAVGRERVLTAAVARLNSAAFPDYTQNAKQDQRSFLELRDRLQQVQVGAEWDRAQIMPMLAKKAVVLKSVTYDENNLLRMGLTYGANPNTKDPAGKAAIHYIVSFKVENTLLGTKVTPRPILLFQSLLDHAKDTTKTNQQDFTLTDGNGDTPLHIALQGTTLSNKFLGGLMGMLKDADYNIKNTANLIPIMSLFQGTAPLEDFTKTRVDMNQLRIIIKKSDLKARDNNKQRLAEIAIRATARIPDAMLASLISNMIVDKDRLPMKTLAASLGADRVLTLAELDKVSAGTRSYSFPAWVPADIVDILIDPAVGQSVAESLAAEISAVDKFVEPAGAGTPSTFETLVGQLQGSYFWDFLRNSKFKTYAGLPYRSYAPGPQPVAVHFEDSTVGTIEDPYTATYRPTTIYQPDGDPTGTFAAGQLDLAKRNNEVLRKIAGKELITPTTQPLLRAALAGLYYAQFNPALSGDVTTALLNLLMKFRSLKHYHANFKQNKVITKTKTNIANIISFLNAVLTKRFRFVTTAPSMSLFPSIRFTGAISRGAAVATAGIIPILPGLGAVRHLPPMVHGLGAMHLRNLGSLSSTSTVVAMTAITNLFTGDPISAKMLAATYSTLITLDKKRDIITHMPVAPSPPVAGVNYPPAPTTANAEEVNATDSLYVFLEPLGLTANFKGKFYILRPAELFIALFHRTPLELTNILGSRNHPFIVLLRDYCVPAALGYANASGVTANVPLLTNVLTSLQRI